MIVPSVGRPGVKLVEVAPLPDFCLKQSNNRSKKKVPRPDVGTSTKKASLDAGAVMEEAHSLIVDPLCSSLYDREIHLKPSLQPSDALSQKGSSEIVVTAPPVFNLLSRMSTNQHGRLPRGWPVGNEALQHRLDVLLENEDVVGGGELKPEVLPVGVNLFLRAQIG